MPSYSKKQIFEFLFTFSYSPTSKPSTQELEEPEDVDILTPTTWNPHSDAYVINEESMLDWEGNMKHETDHEKRVVLEDIPSDDTMISSLALCEKDPSDPSKLMRFTVLLKSRKEKYLMNSFRGDGEHQ